jgi:endonuclease YncB( thermonuclease family)
MRVLSLLKHLILAAAGLAVLFLPLLPVRARETLSGPVIAHVTEVIDGDTVKVQAQVWIGQSIQTSVRLAGIDAPEIGSHAHCVSERDKADAAKAYLASLVGDRQVTLRDIKDDKYGGRVDARIFLADGRDVSELMLKKQLALPYDGGHKTPWCGLAAE